MLTRLMISLGALINKYYTWKLANKPGWVVLGWSWGNDDDQFEPGQDYQAVHGGTVFGMDYATGRFPDMKSAEAFAEYLNKNAKDGFTYYADHESTTVVTLIGGN